MISFRAYNIHSVLWRYIIDRFVIDVCLKTIVAKKRNAHISLKCIKRFYAFESIASSQVLFYTYCSRYFVFCEAILLYDKVEERKAFCSSCNGANSFYFLSESIFHLSLSLSLSTLLSVFNQSCPLLCFYATFHFALFLF